MAKYTRHNSNYIKTGRHQSLRDGSTIFERDWVTVGSQLHFGPGKVPYYTDGNFIFTTSPLPSYQKKHKNGVTVGVWKYDDVQDTSPIVNQILVDEYTEDIRSFAYYGSCVELVRVSVENIINTFPGNITLTDERLDKNIDGYIVNNPFQIDLHTDNVVLGQYDNELRWMSLSYDKYLINGEEITEYKIGEWRGDPKCPDNDQYYKSKSPVITVTINGNYVLNGYYYNGEIIFCYDGTSLEIRPKQEYVDAYFSKLKGFEKQLLNVKSKPLYSNVFITPIEHDSGFVYYKRTYTWPSNGYCIDITSTTYFDFLNRLGDMAQAYDELTTDNIWRRMTHEAIKNYDWTYTRVYSEGEEDDNVEGGERMHKVLNVIGRVFDDVKCYMDKIKMNNRITYDGDRNLPNALISDKLELGGWDVYTTIPSFEDKNLSDVRITEEFMNDNNLNWYPTKSYDSVSASDVDIDFVRRMVLSSKRILSTKGTVNAIEMVMGMFGYGDDDFTITEEYRTVVPRDFDEDIGGFYTLGEAIVEANLNKGVELQYNDDVSGIPVGSFIVYEQDEHETDKIIAKTYLIPYYDQRRVYDGDFTFQSKGGWLYDKNKQTSEELNDYAWNETVSYLHLATNVQDLLSVNPNTVTNGDIYYVANLNDLIQYTEDENYSHFFVLTDDFNPEIFSSWTQLDLTDEDSDDEYVKKALYLRDIIPDNIANNPHVGYGKYDLGEEYFEYMKKPFKYVLDNNDISGEYKDMAEDVTFDVSESHLTNDKIVDFIKDKPDVKETYYLNSKVVHFRNNIDNEYYKKYFRDVIMKYVMQVVPSTTIMILEDF